MNDRSWLIVAALCVLPGAVELHSESRGLPEGVVNTQAPGEAPIAAAEALKRITVPDGFNVQLFANEPDLMQPIAFAFDDRGRIWVAENYSYPQWQTKQDRILIFTDRDGDGRFDERKVFWEGGHRVFGIEVGFGGVWVVAAPNMLFIPDRDGDDVPDGEPEILLDGFTLDARHNSVNGLKWGLDGWLYGRHGITAPSTVGAPGTAEDQRLTFDCSIWRYHPTRHVLEVVVQGTTNPWGLDFNDYGQAFFTNNVNGHLWHIVPGAKYERMRNHGFFPNIYETMQVTADHQHWLGNDWTESREGKGVHAELGGGHSHCGGMIYLGDNWPDEYRNTIMLCNTHGNRINHDLIERRGSGYVGRHGRDFLMANDKWFRGVTIDYGPDGGVFVSDWNDYGECHDRDGSYYSSGRIYKITYGDVKPLRDLDLARLSNDELVELQLHRNDWYVRHARRLLQERAVASEVGSETVQQLRAMLATQKDVTRQLRALWTLHAMGATDESLLIGLLAHNSEYVRWWAVQLLCESKRVSRAVQAKFVKMAKEDESAMVRLSLASALQRLPAEDRWPIAAELAAHDKDAADQNLPLMIWYGVQPLVAGDQARAVALIEGGEIPLVRRLIARRMVDVADPQPTALVALLGRTNDQMLAADVLSGMRDGLRGRRDLMPPGNWAAVYSKLSASGSEEVRETARVLALMLGDQRALESLKKTMMDRRATVESRAAALAALVETQSPGVAPRLHQLLDDANLRTAAIKGLAAYAHGDTPAVIIRHYASFDDEQKAAAIAVLAGRADYAMALLDAVEAGAIDRRDITPFLARQLQGLKDKKINQRLTSVWGDVRQSDQQRRQRIADTKAMLASAALGEPDLSNGRLLFNQACAACHTLFGEGGAIGPELTGSDRANLDYILENIIDPSAVVSRDYRMTILMLKDGRVLSGVIADEGERTITIQSMTDRTIVDQDQVANKQHAPISIMPEGLLDQLDERQIRDLIGYLGSPRQVPLPAGN